MNFIDVTFDSSGGTPRLVGPGDWSAALPHRFATSVGATSGRKLVAGFRPEHLELDPVEGDTVTLPGRADVVEYLGNEELLHVTAAEQGHRRDRRLRPSGQAGRRAQPDPAALEAPPVRRRVGHQPDLRARDGGRLTDTPIGPARPARSSQPRARRRTRRPRPTRPAPTTTSSSGSSTRASSTAAATSSSGSTRSSGPTARAPSATSPATRAPSRSSRSIPTAGSCSSASGARRPGASCSRSRPGRSTSTRRRAPIEDPDLAVAARARGGDRLPRRDLAASSTAFWTAPGLRERAHAPVPRDRSRPGPSRRAPRAGRGRAPPARAAAVRRRARRRRARRDRRREVDRRAALGRARSGPGRPPRHRRLASRIDAAPTQAAPSCRASADRAPVRSTRRQRGGPMPSMLAMRRSRFGQFAAIAIAILAVLGSGGQLICRACPGCSLGSRSSPASSASRSRWSSPGATATGCSPEMSVDHRRARRDPRHARRSAQWETPWSAFRRLQETDGFLLLDLGTQLMSLPLRVLHARGPRDDPAPRGRCRVRSRRAPGAAAHGRPRAHRRRARRAALVRRLLRGRRLGGPSRARARGVDLRRRAERDRQPEVGPRLVRAAELLQALAEGEMRVVGRRVDLEELLERRAEPIVLAGVVVGPAERLEDRRLARLLAIGPLEDDRRLGEVALVRRSWPRWSSS